MHRLPSGITCVVALLHAGSLRAQALSADSLSLAGAVATALASDLRPEGGAVPIAVQRAGPGWLSITADSIIAKYREQLVSGNDTAGALRVRVDSYRVHLDTVLVRLVLTRCDGHGRTGTYWAGESELAFVHGETGWQLLARRPIGAADGICESR
jgi:hypothetical protein